jgi:nicotinamide-nucleotide amidase
MVGSTSSNTRPDDDTEERELRCEVLAVGTELLLGQIVDTNSAWIGEQLAASGIDSYEHRVVGDNQTRIVDALRDLLTRADAVLVCGGLGPTQDDLTRDAIAELMGVPLVRRMELAEQIATMFRTRLRDMPANNMRQADVPEGGAAIPNPLGTAPGLVCPVGNGKFVYAVPGVPYEMQEMVAQQVIPDLLKRSGEASTIVSRSLKTWGTSESALAEMVARRLDALDAAGNPTIAFLARGIEGLVVRITAKGATEGEARALADAEEEELRAILGDLVFGVDDETMEYAVLERLRARGWSLGVAESVTGGFIGARIVNVPGASDVFRGTIASYATEVKRSVLGVTAENVVSEEAAREMAAGAQRVLGADVGIAVTGVAGPAEQDGVAVGTVCFAIAFPGRPPEAVTTRLPGDRERIRQFATISLLNLVRLRLDALQHTA